MNTGPFDASNYCIAIMSYNDIAMYSITLNNCTINTTPEGLRIEIPPLIAETTFILGHVLLMRRSWWGGAFTKISDVRVEGVYGTQVRAGDCLTLTNVDIKLS